MKTHKGVKCRSKDGRQAAPATRDNYYVVDDETELGEEGLIAVFPEDQYHFVRKGGNVLVYQAEEEGDRTASQTQDHSKSHSQRLKELAEQYRKHVWW